MSPRLSMAAAKIAKAEEFLEAGRLCADDWYDVAVSVSVSAGVNAADALRILAGEFAATGEHEAAVLALKNLGYAPESKQLRALLQVKNRAQYLAARCSSGEAADAVKRAERLVGSARGQYEKVKSRD